MTDVDIADDIECVVKDNNRNGNGNESDDDENDDDDDDMYLVQCSVEDTVPATPIYLLRPTWVGTAHIVGPKTRLASVPMRRSEANTYVGSYMVDVATFPTRVNMSGITMGTLNVTCTLSLQMDTGAEICNFASARANIAVIESEFSAEVAFDHHYQPRSYFPRNPYTLDITVCGDTHANMPHVTFRRIVLVYEETLAIMPTREV